MNKDIQKLLRYFLLSGIFIIPFIVFIVANNMFFPFITGKNFTFRIIVEILVAVWALLAYWDASYRPKFSWLLASFVTLMAVLFLADTFAVNPAKSFWSNFERMEGFVGIAHLFAYFLVVVSTLKTEKIWMRLFNVILGASVIMGIYGLLQLNGNIEINQGSVRVDGTLGNAAYLAVYNLFNIFLATFLLLKQKREMWLRVVYGLIIVLNIVILYHTETRGTILGLLGGTLVATTLIALFERKNKIARKWAVGFIVGVFLIIGGFLAIKDTSFVKNSSVLSRFSSISLNETTTKSRFMIWDMAWNGFKERPVLGWGQEGFNFIFNKYYNPDMYKDEPWFDRAHNVLFDWLTTAGILGLLAYLSLFVSGLYMLWFGTRALSVVSKSILTGLLAGYFVHNLFVFDNLISYIMFFSLLGYLHFANTKESRFKRFTESVSVKIKKMFSTRMMDVVIAPLVVIVLIFSIYFINYKALATNYTLLNALKPHPQEKGFLTNLKLFKETIAYDSFGTQEAREQLTRMADTVSSYSVSKTVKDSFLTYANTQLKDQADAIPEDTRGQLFYATFLNKYGRYDDAIVYYNRALKLSPKKQAIYFGLVGSYLNKKEYKKALSVAKQAFDLEPKYNNAREIYAISAIYNKDLPLVKKLLVSTFGTVILPDARFARAYETIGQYKNSILIWKTIVSKDPKNMQSRLSLASAYVAGGYRTKAIKEIEGVIKINPKFKDQGDYYIKEIRAGKRP